jgi:hypothetical protein
MSVDLLTLYGLLRDIAVTRTLPISHQELSRRYLEKTGVWVDPFWGWTAPLKAIHAWCAHHHPRILPPLPALVINAWEGLPERSFWGRWGTPPEPSALVWRQLLGRVYATDWPADPVEEGRREPDEHPESPHEPN